MFAQGIGMMVGLGGGSLISRLLGAGENQRAERALGNSIVLSIFFSTVLMSAVLPFTLLGNSYRSYGRCSPLRYGLPFNYLPGRRFQYYLVCSDDADTL